MGILAKIVMLLSLALCLQNSHATVHIEKAPMKDTDPTKILDPVGEPNRYQLFFNNEWDNALAPFTYQSSIILLSGAMATYLVFKDNFEEKRKARLFRRWKRKKLWSTVGDTLGWGVLPVAYLSLKALQNYLDDGEDKAAQERRTIRWQNAEYITKSVAYTALATFALKMTVSQGRPKDSLKRDSFPSGHASSSFAFSTAVWLAHGPWPLLGCFRYCYRWLD